MWGGKGRSDVKSVFVHGGKYNKYLFPIFAIFTTNVVKIVNKMLSELPTHHGASKVMTTFPDNYKDFV